MRSMNQGKLQIIKQEMEHLNIDVLDVSKPSGLEWNTFSQTTTKCSTLEINSEEME